MREEVEAKIRLRNCDETKTIKEELEKKRAILLEKVVEIDTYYQHPCRDFSKTDEALRVRVSRKDSSKRVKVTYKGPKQIRGIAKSREEVEVEVLGEAAKILLEKLGFRQVAVVEKTREYYSLAGGKLLVSIDRVEGLGCFIEIEAREGGLEAIEAFLEEAGLKGYRPVYKSYLELIIEKHSKNSPREKQ